MTTPLALGLTAGPAVATARAAAGVPPAATTLIQQVGQTGVLEMTIATRAAQQGTSPSIRWVGQSMLRDHAELDPQIAAAAASLGVTLPTQPSAAQMVALRRMTQLSGAAFDRTYVNTLRANAQQVLQAAQQLGASKPSDPAVQQLVSVVVAAESKHMAWLDATGLVTGRVTQATLAPSAVLALANGAKDGNNSVSTLFVLAGLGGVVLTVASLVLKPRRSGGGGSDRREEKSGGGSGDRARAGAGPPPAPAWSPYPYQQHPYHQQHPYQYPYPWDQRGDPPRPQQQWAPYQR